MGQPTLRPQRYAMHRVPEWNDGVVVGVRYFGTVTKARDFAKSQCRALGHKGYTVDSLPRDVVEELLNEHAPIPDYYQHARR